MDCTRIGIFFTIADLRRMAGLAVDFLAMTFLAGDFLIGRLADDFLAIDFFAIVFFAAIFFLPMVFFAIVFPAAGFLAIFRRVVGFRADVFFAVVFLAVVFFAEAFFLEAAFIVPVLEMVAGFFANFCTSAVTFFARVVTFLASDVSVLTNLLASALSFLTSLSRDFTAADRTFMVCVMFICDPMLALAVVFLDLVLRRAVEILRLRLEMDVLNFGFLVPAVFRAVLAVAAMSLSLIVNQATPYKAPLGRSVTKRNYQFAKITR
ncbi:MAG: hypothetical protein ACE5Q3_12500 [Alphaproteobacteria bacterium]